MTFYQRLRRHVRTTKHLKLYMMFRSVLRFLEDKRGKFVSFHSRPQFAKDFGLYSDALKDMPRVALVLQGPLVKEKNFTLETVKMYKKTFPHADLIVSTWKSEDANYVEVIKNEGADVVLSDTPAYPGQQNINFQITGSYAGILRAQERGAQYVCKTRTDQRIYAPNVIEFFLNLLKTFPVESMAQNAVDAAGQNPVEQRVQKQRLIGVSLNTYKYRLYAVSDMLMFGDIDDMLLYWGAKLDERPVVTHAAKSMREFGGFRVCETYLTTEFLQAIGENFTWTLADSWKQYGKHFCIVDQESIGLYWFKYDRHKAARFEPYAAIKNTQELSFAEWMNMYAGMDNKIKIPEHALDVSFTDHIPQK